MARSPSRILDKVDKVEKKKQKKTNIESVKLDILKHELKAQALKILLAELEKKNGTT